MFYLLVMLTKKKALNKIKAIKEGHGLECWRVLYKTWEPKNKGRFAGLLQKILLTKFSSKTDIPSEVADWERMISEYERQSSETGSDNVKLGLL